MDMYLILITLYSIIIIVLGDKRECASNICLNGGTCHIDDLSRRFLCQCPPGFSGSLCQETCSLECANGVCVKGSHGNEECQCAQGWYGALCEVSGSSNGCTKNDDCGFEEICIENDRGLKICTGDQCKSRPCKNNATCVLDSESFRCICPAGFAGKLCGSDVNECELDPCQNGGTCINVEGSFECLCENGFRGKRCEELSSSVSCATNPCLNQGTCIDTQNGFRCICLSGFQGKICQDEAKFPTCECPDSKQKCVLLNGNQTCVCPDGSTGAKCSENITCDMQPCRNGGKCENTSDGFHCHCLPEFRGETCEEIIQCFVDGNICLNGGSCVRGLSENHCECASNYTGRHCEHDLLVRTSDPCDSNSCLNGGTCHADGMVATCECRPGYSGIDCSKQNTSSCLPNPCKNNGECQPVGDFGENGIACICRDGYHGHFCEQLPSEWNSLLEEVNNSSTTVTTATSISEHLTSINTTYPELQISCNACVHSTKCVESSAGPLCICQRGYQGSLCDQQGDACDSTKCHLPLICQQHIALGFVRTKCSCPIGLTGRNCETSTSVSFDENSLFIHQSPNVMLGSSSMHLPFSIAFAMRTTMPTVHIVSGENIFGQKLFSISMNEGRFMLTLQETTYDKLIPFVINDGTWCIVRLEKNESELTVSVINDVGYQLLLHSFPVLMGFDVFATRFGKVSDIDYFVGCIADLNIGDTPIDIANSNRGTGITNGCKYSAQCSRNPCLNGGSCIDLWTHSSCVCNPPFLPPLCMHSLPPSTFGHENHTSFAEINIPPEISQLMRFTTTIHLILRSNKPNGTILYLGETGDDVTTFISLSMVNGYLLVQSRIGGNLVHELKSHKKVDDNKDHIVYIRRKKRNIKLNIDDVLDSEGTMQSRFDHPLFVEKLQLGSGRNVTKSAFITDTHFKGSLQDIQINEKSVVLHEQPSFPIDLLGPVSNLEYVLEGSVSDDICAISAQCEHGICHNTFNDFECQCELGFYGKKCNQKDHCSGSPCPTNGECQNVGDGYICTSPVTIKPTSLVSFKMSQPVQTISTFELTVRTHSMIGHILTIVSREGSFMLSLANGQPLITGNSSLTIRKNIADGQWHTITFDGNIFYVDSAGYGLPPSIQLPTNMSSVSLLFGATIGGPSFSGCLKHVVVGHLPEVSFYRKDEFGKPGNIDFWEIDKRYKLATSCLSSPQCDDVSPCVRGTCRDLWNAFACDCPPGFEGAYCEVNTDECAKIKCERGYCVDEVGVARCHCDTGFAGAACDEELDLCAEIPCKNGGLCTSSNGSYTCECKAGWTGKSCDIKDEPGCYETTCKNNGSCKADNINGKCLCTAGFYGDFCEKKIDFCMSKPCVHGYCESTLSGFKCKCYEGYSGDTCSSIFDMCTVSSCSGRGRCTPVWNATMCTCDKRWRGKHCDQLLDECMDVPCENDGVCETTSEGFQCRCRKYYLGDRCEVVGSCLKQPCERGECIQFSNNTHLCNCPTGYEGKNCEKRIDYCVKNPCLNEGSCESLIDQYKCHCVPGFKGINCETNIDECLFGFCSNGSTCRDRIADYDCICDGTGFQGKNCTIDIDECTVTSNCVNGQCTNTHGSYRCDCEDGFIGSRCSVRDPCRPDAFNRTTHTCVHGVCINPTVQRDDAGHETSVHECKCHWGYTGSQCLVKVSEQKMLALSRVLGPMIVVLSVLAILGCVLFVIVFRGKRALHGHYSPSYQEQNGARLQMNSMVKLPPEERLI